MSGTDNKEQMLREEYIELADKKRKDDNNLNRNDGMRKEQRRQGTVEAALPAFRGFGRLHRGA